MDTVASEISYKEDRQGESGEHRILPQNIDAEQALLGALLIDNDAYDKVSDFLEPKHFFVPVHGRVYEAARALIQRGQVATAVTLKAYFASDEALIDIGGADYLERLVSSAVSFVHSGDYGRVIVDLSLRRDLIRLGETVMERSFDPAVDGHIRITAGGSYTLYLNGDLVGADDAPATVETYEVSFKRRENQVAVVVEHDGTPSPYGLFCVLEGGEEDDDKRRRRDVLSQPDEVEEHLRLALVAARAPAVQPPPAA